MIEKTARKWQKVTKEKNDKQETSNTTTFLIKTHERSVSQAQILVPAKFKQFAKPDTVLIIEPSNKQFIIYVQATKQSLLKQKISQQQNDKCQISILKNVADLYGAVYGDKGMFRGQIRVVSEKQFLPNRELEYAEIVIRNNYFSRRDQYKVSEILKEKITHVYSRKVIHFQSTRIEVTNMMRSNHQVLKTGFITKNTKLIFRSSCAKTAILVQLSKETFDLNSTRQLYLDRMIQFLIVYFNRNLFFGNKHRVEIILYARLFYPQFKSLTDAYNYLMKEATIGSTENKFQVNYAVSLQKDYKGRIYQDAYRKIIWQSSQLSTFKKFFLEKVSQFLFTLNWECNKSKNSQFISRSINSKVANEFQCVQIKQTWRIKPFIHRMKCQLSDSSSSNLFQAICLLSQQYKHHYKFRALDQTGNAIIILSAGRSQYQTDKTTYKMAKSYIYLTNISCMMVNVNKKVDKIKVHLYDIPRQMFKDQNDIKKLQKLLHWCIEEYVYQSPVNERIRFNSHKAGFQMKSFIYPQDILPIAEKTEMFKYFGKDKCHCSSRHGQIGEHFYLDQKEPGVFQEKIKEIDWISSYYVNNDAIKIHEKFYERFYEKANFQADFYQPFNKAVLHQFNKDNIQYANLSYSFINQLDIFEDDLEKIIIKKDQWLQIGPMKNQLNHRFDKYINQSTMIKKKKEKEEQLKNDLFELLERTNRKMFQVQVTRNQNQLDFQMASNQDFGDRSKNRMDDFYQSKPTKQRKGSIFVSQNYIPITQPQNQPPKPKINIFQQTLRNKQYNIAAISNQRSKKFLSHNKERLRGNYKESNIHYLMSYFSESNFRKLMKFFRKEFYETLSQQQIKINEAFQYEKQWKSICFPILTPIYTKYREDFKEIEIILDNTETGDEKTLQNDACKLLMQNYQLSQIKANRTTLKFSKGNIIKTLQKNNDNITKTYTIDKEKQQSLIPFLLYRYLLYEEKDYRFCSKTIYFQDKNFYDKQNKDQIQTQTKSLKLLFLYDPCDDCRDSVVSYNPVNGQNKRSPIDDFKRLFKEKFHQEMIVTEKKQQVSPLLAMSAPLAVMIDKKDKDYGKQDSALGSPPKVSKNTLPVKPVGKESSLKRSFASIFHHEKQRQYLQAQPQTPKTRQIQFSLADPTNKKYNSQQIRMVYDSQFCQKNLFKIVIEWDHCSSILVNQFVDNLITIGRRSKLISYRTTTEDVFNIEWNMYVVGEIVFSNELSVGMLQYSVYRNDDWYYDTMGFYMDTKGVAFIKFQKEKKLVLWKDNNYEKKTRQPELYNEQYNKFFMISAAFDFLGEMIQQAYHIFARKNAEKSFEMKEKANLQDPSINGSYNSGEQTKTVNIKKM